MSNIFQSVKANRPPRSFFDLSHTKRFTCDFGQLIPLAAKECYPGDVAKIDINAALVRLQPLVAPLMQDIDVKIDFFYVANRPNWSPWVDFITGGEDGTDSSTLPTWTPSSTTVGSLWDYFGLPVGITPDADHLPVAFALYAYNNIYNEYMRDQNLVNEVALTDENVKKVAHYKDYFTSALPEQQKGTPPALPVTGSAIWDASVVATDTSVAVHFGSSTTSVGENLFRHDGTPGSNSTARNNFVGALNDNTLDATTFDVNDLRLAFQIQKWMERNSRTGARYTESILGHFGVRVNDDRLQRPEYIGGYRQRVIQSEVLQTSESNTTDLGTMAGHGISYGQSHVGKYRVKEHGYLMGLLRIVPKASYSQGIERQYLRRTKYDYYWPEFANLGEQAVKQAEIYAGALKADNEIIFGYQGRYNELRYAQDVNCGQFGYNQTYNYWHLGREFGSAPSLNQSFIEIDAITGGASNPYKRCFAAPAEPGCLVEVNIGLKMARPMPYEAEPGFIDH